VTAALNKAWSNSRAKNEPVVLIGHSLGGVILYDLISNPSGSDLAADFKASLLLTVGSQVGVFEEFKLYESSKADFSAANNRKVPRLGNIESWMNVFDPVDLLSFRCAPIFEGATDYVFSSVTGLLSAHSAYFGRPQFYARLRERLSSLGYA